MRLIDADELKELLRKQSLSSNREWLQMDLDLVIDNAPTVDLDERDNDAFETGYIKGLCENRPQGEWKATGQTMGLYYVYACNKCGIYNKGKTNFCPNCGAKMKGGAE